MRDFKMLHFGSYFLTTENNWKIHDDVKEKKKQKILTSGSKSRCYVKNC